MARYILALIAVVGLAGCGSEAPAPETQDSASQAPEAATDLPEVSEQKALWQSMTLAQCEPLLQGHQEQTAVLAGQVSLLADAPTADTLRGAQSAWRQALSSWGGASLCLQYPLPSASPIPHGARWQRTAAAPALAGFVDAVPGYEDSGIVHDETMALTLQSLLRQHQVTDDGEVSLGFYALEVLLFGSVRREPGDFAPAADLDSIPLTEQTPAARRSRMATLLALDLTSQASVWQDYWDDHAGPLNPETDTATLLWVWSRALEDATRIGESLARGQIGRALSSEHDLLYLNGLTQALAHWWSDPTTLEQVEQAGISTSDWRATDDRLAALSADSEPEAFAAATERAARLLRELSRLLDSASLPLMPA